MGEVLFHDLRRNKSDWDGMPTGKQIEKCRGELGWTQEHLSQIAEKFGFPITQQQISSLEKGIDHEPTKPGYKNVKRLAKDPNPLAPGFDSNISYPHRLKILFFRLGFIFPDAETVVRVNADNFVFWIKEAAEQAGFESSFDGTDPKRDDERLWKNVRHYVERFFPELKSYSKRSSEEFRAILDEPL